MVEGAQSVNHFNKLNTIINHLVLVDIKFNDEICAQILLALLSNSWEHIRALVGNSIGSVN